MPDTKDTLDYRDPNSAGYAEKWRRKYRGRCYEPGCTNVGGSAWGPWCCQHNAERFDRIDESLARISASFVKEPGHV
jgi:hypothetical protein